MFDGEYSFRSGAARIMPLIHRGGSGVIGTTLERSDEPPDTGDSFHNAERITRCLEYWTLFDMQFDEGFDGVRWPLGSECLIGIYSDG